MASIQTRVVFGFLVAVVSVLTFHQGMWALLHFLGISGLTMPPPYPMDPVPPYSVPRIVDLCFWGGLWGALFGAVWRGPRASNWWAGLLLGFAAALTGLFIVPAIKGLPVGGGWVLGNWIKSFLINGTWGLGVGLLLLAVPPRYASRGGHAYR